MNIIEIKNLKKYFKEVKAVDDISFNVKQGDLFAFLGLNGAGKSTTINVICGAISKDAGYVSVCGKDIDVDMQSIKRDLGVVFQNSVLDTNLTVYDNLYTRAVLYGLSDAEFKVNLTYFMQKLEFEDILHRPLNKLSGGQKRRIDIARALIHKPKLLILDEPTTGLDPKTRALVWGLLNELRKSDQMTILLTTHYMEEAAEADNVVIIDGGKIVATGTPNNLKNKYAVDKIKIYEYDIELLELLHKDNVEFKQFVEYIEIVVESTDIAKNLLVKYSKYITDFEVIKGNMDSVFLNITGKELKVY